MKSRAVTQAARHAFATDSHTGFLSSNTVRVIEEDDKFHFKILELIRPQAHLPISVMAARSCPEIGKRFLASAVTAEDRAKSSQFQSFLCTCYISNILIHLAVGHPETPAQNELQQLLRHQLTSNAARIQLDETYTHTSAFVA